MARSRRSALSAPASVPASTALEGTRSTNNLTSLTQASLAKYSSIRLGIRQSVSLKSKHLYGEFARTTRRWKSDGVDSEEKPKKVPRFDPEKDAFATDSPKSRDEIVRDAKSFKELFHIALGNISTKREFDDLVKDKGSMFSKYRKTDKERVDFYGMTPRQEGIPNSESLRSTHDLKLRRNTVLRKTMWYSFAEFAFDSRNWGYALRERKLIVFYTILTAGLLGYAYLSPDNDYDFFHKREFEEKERQRKAEERPYVLSIDDTFISRAWDSVGEYASNFSLVEPFRKLGYLIGGSIVALRMLHATWYGDPISEDERLIRAHTPISLARDLRPDEYEHVNPLIRIMSTGHITGDPWTALIPPSPWAPHLTIVIESELLFSLGFNDRGEKVMRKRPFADYFISSLGENAEIIISSAQHSKASAKNFFKLFDPYGIASHTFTAEDHRWDGMSGWIKPLEERYIGRRPERLLVLDANYDHCGTMCQNVLRVKPWQGNDGDTTFLELTPIVKCALFSI